MNDRINNFKTYEHVTSELIIDGCNSSLSPDISIVIPTFRRPHLISETIASVVKQSNSEVNIELVIVDNDAESTDGALEDIVSKYLPFNVRLFRNKKNIGMFGNWNRCIELARAPILTILNDDDLLHPDFIRTVYKPGMKEMRVVSHRIFSTLADCIWSEVKTRINFSSLSAADFFIGNPVPGSLGMAMNKQCAIEIGGYNESMWPTADYDFTYRYFLAYGVYKTESFLSAYRWSENESLKLDTLLGFMINDYQFRKHLIYTLNLGRVRSIVLRVLCKLLAIYFAFLYKDLNPDFDIKESFKRAEIPLLGMFLFKNKIFFRIFGLVYPRLIKLLVP